MIYCCQEHVELALDTVVDEHETYPLLNEIPKEKQLSTSCEYCRNVAVYMVGN
ncbi:CxxH/CxxC protein [Peribacillus glennii]|uniref:CxxH/CxxC protein n=1 Tax=Peribacillus glennii TaxID=2303991 RepID=A0A372LA40_9BACI|nr:CxxH/CxxC protein [Peribacillus glennii]RFU62482.1 CxxH/CxxC protein [Peribacillus glennii]